jgi:hypothetical protein
MAFRTKKISQMDPKGANLASTDLLEISQLVSGSYVTKSITGAQIAASAPAAAWGTITGTLSTQTDLNTALSGKVPTSRTLTINGTTQDLSADRTFTISTGITIGTTAITSGTVGRVLFEGTGNVVQESANLFWDNTNGRLGVNVTGAPTRSLEVWGTTRLNGAVTCDGNITLVAGNSVLNCGFITIGNGGTTANIRTDYAKPISLFPTPGTESLRLFANGNLVLQSGGTFTDAGFKLDVNGTARVTNALNVQGFSISRGNNPAVLGNAQIGEDNLSAITSGIYNFAFGTYALKAMTTGNYNIGIGLSAIEAGTGGAGNVAIGRQAMYFGGAGSNSVAIGHQAGDNAGSGSNNIYIGYQARGVSGAQSNRTWIGNSSTTTTWLGGSLLLGTTTDVASSLLTMESTTKGFLPPRMTTTQKNAIASPATGLMVYDTTLNLMALYNGTTWTTL